MDFTNINDPAGVSALLERLRSSQAWTDLQAHQDSQTSSPAEPSASASIKEAPNVSEQRPSVTSLLSQLRSVPQPIQTSGPSLRDVSPSSSSLIPQYPARSPMSAANTTKDLRSLTFQQALPRLAELSDDPKFVDAVTKLRRDQSILEKQLWQERHTLHNNQAEKVKIAVNKAKMLGTGLSEREAELMKQVFEAELKKFDRERVLPAWDGLISRQQATLERFGVPAMSITDEKTDRERQQRIIQVLEGIIGSDEPDGTS